MPEGVGRRILSAAALGGRHRLGRGVRWRRALGVAIVVFVLGGKERLECRELLLAAPDLRLRNVHHIKRDAGRQYARNRAHARKLGVALGKVGQEQVLGLHLFRGLDGLANGAVPFGMRKLLLVVLHRRFVNEDRSIFSGGDQRVARHRIARKDQLPARLVLENQAVAVARAVYDWRSSYRRETQARFGRSEDRVGLGVLGCFGARHLGVQAVLKVEQLVVERQHSIRTVAKSKVF